MENDKVLTLEEMRKYLRIGRNVALRLLQEKEINGKKVGNQWRILKSEVDKYLRNHEDK